MNKPATILANEHPVAIIYRDGRTETINLGELSIRNLYRWIEHFSRNDVPSLVALCAGKPLDWVDSLTDDSFGDLSKLAFELNFPRATALSSKDVTVAALLKPSLLQIASLAQASDGPLSSVKSPAPAASASAAAIGSESSN
jgi:hypothetical protein